MAAAARPRRSPAPRRGTAPRLAALVALASLAVAGAPRAGIVNEPVSAHGRSGPGSTILLDDAGAPAVVCVDPVTRALQLVRRGAAGWEPESIAAVAGPGGYGALAATCVPARRTADGRTAILFQAATSESYWSATGSPGAWALAPAIDVPHVGAWPSFALDAATNPVVTGYSGACNELAFFRRDAGTIVRESPFGACAGGTRSATEAAAAGRVLVLGVGENCAVEYAVREIDGTWTRSLVSGCDAHVDVAMTLGPDGEPRIAFAENSARRVRFARHGAGGWTFATFDSGGTYAEVALALDSGGGPHAAYVASGQLRYARERDGGWLAGVIDSTSGPGARPSLAIDAQGLPHVTYFSAADSAVHHAYGLPVLAVLRPEAPATLRALGDPARGRPRFLASLPAGAGAARLELFDPAGRRVRTEAVAAGGGAFTIVTGADLRPGFYAARLVAGGRCVARTSVRVVP